MKTSEQTKQTISVGLINAARAVIVASATLFCCVTAARAQEPDNRIDWRWGRPGVMVVTNAPTAVTVTNIATDVASGVANTMFGPRVTALEGALDGGTNNWNTAYSWGDHAGLYRVIGWVPSWGDLTDIPQDFPPSTHEHDYTTITNPPWLTSFTETDEIALSRVTVLEGGTNNWNTAYGWGDHAGLYKASDWVPSWTEVTDKPATFPPEAHQHDYTSITNPPWLEEYTETDEIALAELNATNAVLSAAITNEAAMREAGDQAGIEALATHTNRKDNPHGVTASQVGALTNVPQPYTVRDSTDTNRWWRFEGTQAVQYELGALTTNYTVTLSADFMETVGNTRPAWTNNVFPFTDGDWLGVYDHQWRPPFNIVYTIGEPVLWMSANEPEFPAIISGSSPNSQGTATVYQHIYYQTNATGNVLSPVPTNLVTYAQLLAWWVETGAVYATTQHVEQAIAAIPVPDMSDHPTFSQIAASNALPYTAWTGTITPANGTATVSIAHGNMPVLVTAAPCVLTLDPTGYGTAGVSRVSLSYYTGGNSFTFATNIINYAETPTVDTNGWNTLLIRRVSDGAWKGVGL